MVLLVSLRVRPSQMLMVVVVGACGPRFLFTAGTGAVMEQIAAGRGALVVLLIANAMIS